MVISKEACCAKSAAYAVQQDIDYAPGKKSTDDVLFHVRRISRHNKLLLSAACDSHLLRDDPPSPSVLANARMFGRRAVRLPIP